MFNLSTSSPITFTVNTNPEAYLGFEYNPVTQQCDEICGDGMLFDLPCDDGNTINGDGCSSTCQI